MYLKREKFKPITESSLAWVPKTPKGAELIAEVYPDGNMELCPYCIQQMAFLQVTETYGTYACSRHGTQSEIHADHYVVRGVVWTVYHE